MSFGDDVYDIELPPAPADPLAAWPAFAAEVRSRLEQERAAYGDRSFSADPDELLRELQQEALDLAGWGYVLFRRIEAMRARLASCTRTSARGQGGGGGGGVPPAGSGEAGG